MRYKLPHLFGNLIAQAPSLWWGPGNDVAQPRNVGNYRGEWLRGDLLRTGRRPRVGDLARHAGAGASQHVAEGLAGLDAARAQHYVARRLASQLATRNSQLATRES